MTQIYVGNGHKYEQNATFYPVDPPLIEMDPKEYESPKDPDQYPPEPKDVDNASQKDGSDNEQDL